MEPFVVNLADAGATRFLRVNLALAVRGGEEVAKEIEENALEKARIRSAILELLAQQQSDTLATPEGKDELKKLIAERSQHAAHELEVVDVLFTEFVIQF
jgi:flagellar protein FliL